MEGSPRSERLLITVRECQALTGLSEATVRRLIAAGTLPSVRVGRAVRIPLDPLRRWVKASGDTGLPDVAAPVPPEVER